MGMATDTEKGAIQSSAGGQLPDGSLLEMVRNPSSPEQMAFLRFDGERIQVADRIDCAGRTYIPINPSASTLRAIYFPTGPKNHGSVGQLFAKLVGVVSSFFPVPDRDLRLLAYFILSTWVSDALPMAVSLLISGSSAAEASQLFRLLRCLCRRAVRLGDISRSGLCAMPIDLGPCLLMQGLKLNGSTRAILKACSSRGSFIARSGNFLDLHCAKVLSFEENEMDDSVAAGMLRVALLPAESPTPILNASDEERISAEFQGMLLDYRVRTYSAVVNSGFDVAQFTPEMRALARSLGAAVVGDTELTDGIIPLLTPDEEEARVRRSVQPQVVIATVLLALVHERRVKNMLVTEITKFVNAALYANGELVEHTPKEVGWRLADLGMHTRRMAGGKGIRFDREFSRSVHNLARRLGVRMSPINFPQCPDCQQSAKPCETKALV